VIQDSGAALLLDGHVELVARCRCRWRASDRDRSHGGCTADVEARPHRRRRRADDASRFDGCRRGRRGLRAVRRTDASGQRPSLEAIAETPAMWAELFEPPCVGFAASREEISEFAAAGADFVLVGDFIWPIRAARRRRCWMPSRRSDRRRTAMSGKVPKPNRNSAGNEDPASHTHPHELPDMTANAAAQVSLTPPGVDTPPAADKSAPSRKPSRRCSKEAAGSRCDSKSRGTCRGAGCGGNSAPVPDDPNADLVYGAYQRGQYKTAFDLASKRAQDFSDSKAMTMLGELYANAMGVKRDYAKAADWYKRAADGGDREGMFALAMLRLGGRAARSIARKPLNCWRPRPSSAIRRRRIIWRCSISTGRRCRRISNAPRTASRRRRRRQSGSAIRPGDVLQRGHRRSERPRQGGTAATGRVTRRHRLDLVQSLRPVRSTIHGARRFCAIGLFVWRPGATAPPRRPRSSAVPVPL